MELTLTPSVVPVWGYLPEALLPSSPPAGSAKLGARLAEWVVYVLVAGALASLPYAYIRLLTGPKPNVVGVCLSAAFAAINVVRAGLEMSLFGPA